MPIRCYLTRLPSSVKAAFCDENASVATVSVSRDVVDLIGSGIGIRRHLNVGLRLRRVVGDGMAVDRIGMEPC